MVVTDDPLKGLSKSTRDALARRAIRAANAIENWSDRLLRTVSNEKRDLDSLHDPVSLKLTLGQFWGLLQEMRELVAEIREFKR